MSFKEIMFRLCLLAQAEILYIVPPENCEVAQYNLDKFVNLAQFLPQHAILAKFSWINSTFCFKKKMQSNFLIFVRIYKYCCPFKICMVATNKLN